jgi:hypothetical protein
MHNRENITRLGTRKHEYVYTKGAKIDSLQLVHKLFVDGHFVKGDMTMFEETLSNSELKDHVCLDNMAKEQRKFSPNFYTKEQKKFFEELIEILNEHPHVNIYSNSDRQRVYQEILDTGCGATASRTLRSDKEKPKINKCYTDEILLKLKPLLDSRGPSDSSRDLQKYQEKTYRKHQIYFADTETFVHLEDVPHQLYLLGFVGYDKDEPTILDVTKFGNDNPRQKMVWKFLREITHNGQHDCKVYWHFLKYDYHVLFKELNIIGECEKENTIYGVTVSFKDCKIEFTDSLKIIPLPIRLFSSALGLTKHQKKEFVAYKYYNPDTARRSRDTLESYAEYLPIKDRESFMKEARKHLSYHKDKGVEFFSPRLWYNDYLKEDCLTLKEGMQKFNQLLLEITDDQISVFDRITISSLSHLFMTVEGAYDGMYEITGNLKKYVGQAITGGRTHVNEKYVCQEIQGKISDFDACSLYPTGMARVCNSEKKPGFAKGKAQRLQPENFDKWEDFHYSVITVKINKVNKHQQMPFIAVKKPDGGVNFQNQPPESSIVVDCVTLRDYIDYHQIEYEILDGVYWDDGGNTILGKTNEHLYRERLKAKASHNTGLSQVLKLMMNSSYGKNLLKASKTEKKIIPKFKHKRDGKGGWILDDKVSPWLNFIHNQFSNIIEYSEINNGKSIQVKLLKVDRSYNMAHVGCHVLSMSKRIMNEVFDTANSLLENSISPLQGAERRRLAPCAESGNPIGTIYYQDTDSMHIDCETIPHLENHFRERYGRELIGKQLGQFHSDFELPGAVDEVYSELLILLGKKFYYDRTVGHDQDGNVIRGDHPRGKGFTAEGLAYAAKQREGGYAELYREGAKGIPIKVWMNPRDEETGEAKFLAEFKRNAVWTKSKFYRTIQFEPSPTVNVGENEKRIRGHQTVNS